MASIFITVETPPKMTTLTAAVLFAFLAVAAANPAVETRESRNVIQTESNLLDVTYQDCLKKDTFACLKYKVLSFSDKLIGVNEITVTDGLTIVKSSAEPAESSRALTADSSLPEIILDKVQCFLETHTIKIGLTGEDVARSFSSSEEDEEETEEIEESRGKKGGKKKIKKLKKQLGPFMSIFGLKALFLAKIALLGIALIAKKALIMGKIALLISGFFAIRKFFGGHGKSGGAPIHTESHVFSHESLHPIAGDHGHGYGGSASGGWGRSAQELAYSAYAQDSEN